VYTGYLALLLGCGVASQNVSVLLLWPVSLLGIVIQAVAEEQVLGAKFGQDYARYVGQTGRFIPRFRSQRFDSCPNGRKKTA
jgi:protein-S-isoprenylcysteine O-methyltransferase Ste14